MAIHKKYLRNNMRGIRTSLSNAEQDYASYRLLENISQELWFKKSQTIALYLANNGEVNTQAIYREAWQQNKHCYLPVLHPFLKRQLDFKLFTPTSTLRKNCYGILEPFQQENAIIKPRLLDVVIIPLVAFTRSGDRLGMGGGYYDKTFAFKKSKAFCNRPLLIGAAYSFQEVDKLAVEPWDIPLNGIVTEHEYIPCTRQYEF